MLPPRPVKTIRGRLLELRPQETLRHIASALRSGLIFLAVTAVYLVIPWIRAWFWGNLELQRQAGPPNRGGRGGVVVIAAFRGEDGQVIPFIDYHSRLGVGEFVFLDMSQDGTLAALLAGRNNCAVWRPRDPMRLDRALLWLNYLRGQYGSGRWCLSLEPNERFVFYRCETRDIRDLVEFLDSERRDHIYALVLEMYGDVQAQSIKLLPGEDPATKLMYFDAYGYSRSERGPYSNVIVRGGLQRRALYKSRPSHSPSLNRTPLAKWRWYFTYVAGRRLIMPPGRNMPHSPNHSNPTACLLRYALLDPEPVLERAARIDAGEIVTDGRPSCYTGSPKLRTLALKHDFSARYTQSADLVDAGLMNPGQWF